eukprot:GHVS01004715.1.p1 GENE.GHVS01004715.1~~GHVS01004715.1.p1  ORF type:complete len:738 (+),score=117.91 GHVS01004715.1:177-2390(+)
MSPLSWLIVFLLSVLPPLQAQQGVRSLASIVSLTSLSVSPRPVCSEGYRFVYPATCLKEIKEEPIFKCPAGSKLVGRQCIHQEWTPAQPFCPRDAELDEPRGVCRSTEVGPADSNCPAGYQQEGKKCVKFEPVQAMAECPKGFGLSVKPKQQFHPSTLPSHPITAAHAPAVSSHHHHTAVHTAVHTPVHTVSLHTAPMRTPIHTGTTHTGNVHTAPITHYNPAGFNMPRRHLAEVKGGKSVTAECVRRTTTEPELGCAPGYLREGSVCTQKEKSDATGTCPTGFDILDGTDCARLLPANPVVHCEDGYVLDGQQCVQHTFVKAKPSCAGGGSFDGSLCKSEKIAIVEMRCPAHYKLQTGKCIRVMEREPVPTCPEGFDLEKAAKINQNGGISEQHQKSGLVEVDNVCYKLDMSEPKWLCPANGQLAVSAHNALRSPKGEVGPTCGVTERVQPLRLCPPDSEASQDGRCIVRQTIQMRFECPDGYLIDPVRRQCFKNHVLPLSRSCKRGELQSGQCVEVEVAPPRTKCPTTAERDRDNTTCVKRNYAAAVLSCGKQGGQVDNAKGQGTCKRTVEVRVKFGCADGTKSGEPAETDKARSQSCLREHARRPDVRCAKGYRMGFGGDCFIVETEKAEFKCPRGYLFVPATDMTPDMCVPTGEANGEENEGEEDQGDNGETSETPGEQNDWGRPSGGANGGGGGGVGSVNPFPNPFAERSSSPRVSDRFSGELDRTRRQSNW